MPTDTKKNRIQSRARMQRRRARITKAGGRQVAVFMAPEASRALKKICKTVNLSERVAIDMAVLYMARHLDEFQRVPSGTLPAKTI